MGLVSLDSKNESMVLLQTFTAAVSLTALILAAGADILVVDIAHGHSDHVIRILRGLNGRFHKTPNIAGNIATPQGVSAWSELVQLQ